MARPRGAGPRRTRRLADRPVAARTWSARDRFGRSATTGSWRCGRYVKDVADGAMPARGPLPSRLPRHEPRSVRRSPRWLTVEPV